MRIKNKIIELLDVDAKEFFYRLLDNDILICIAATGIPDKKNIEKCGDGYLVYAPTAEQQPFCNGRVMPFYGYFPDMKDDAEFWSQRTEEEFIRAYNFIEPQYDVKEVYDFLMEGLKVGTLWNITETKTLKEFTDKENDRKIEIVELYHKGEWNSYVCSIYGINERHTCGVSYDERDLKAAMKHFTKYLKGADKATFNKFIQSEAEM